MSFLAFGVAFLTGAISAGPILKGLIALKSRQNVYNLAPESHQKKQGTPTMGGIIILLGLMAGIGYATFDWGFSLWIFGFSLIGFTDDFIIPKLMKGKRGLGWKQKIVAQLVLAFLAGAVFDIPNELGPMALMVFLVLFFSNAYNFADGLDALAGSLGLILCFGFAGIAACTGQWMVIPMMAALAGAFLPFLFLNAPPAKVFMGDVGALSIGAVFGVVSAILLLGLGGVGSPPPVVDWHPDLILPLLILGFVMIVELVPVPMQVAYFKLTKKRLFPFTPIHHSFEVKGWPESRVVWSFALAQMLLAIVAIGLVNLRARHDFNPEYFDNNVSLKVPILTEARQ
ncbi:MAG TPA: hypothetical protein VGL56_10045 [Fimbriimonadaceae bacterium]|jgi:phospho-N-acetylmuramoyl-pentapeptide-transferase